MDILFVGDNHLIWNNAIWSASSILGEGSKITWASGLIKSYSSMPRIRKLLWFVLPF